MHGLTTSCAAAGPRSKRTDKDKKEDAATRRASIAHKQKADAEEARNKRRTSISEATRSLNAPTPEIPPPPVKPPTNKMGGKGQLYENMLMPLDDMKYGPEFKLSTVSLTNAQLTKLLQGEDGDFSGLERVREGNQAIVMVPNPSDYDKSALVNIYVKGHPIEVDKALSAIRAEVNVANVLEVITYVCDDALSIAELGMLIDVYFVPG